MKLNCIPYFIFHLFLYITHIHPEGFLPGTLVKTASGYSCIEQLKTNNNIISCTTTTTITHAINSQSDCFIKITILDTEICCAPNQKLYSYNQQNWVTANQLTTKDLLTDYNGNPIIINSIKIIRQNCVLHALALKSEHSYCISHLNVIAHNTGHVIVLSIPAIVSTIAPIIKTCLTAAGTYLGIHCAKKAMHKKKSLSDCTYHDKTNSDSYYPDPNDPRNKDKTTSSEHPHGIYKDAPYHHKNSRGNKSKCPDDGERCLDYSIRVGEQRVAIEGNEFVVLRLTRPGEYHGFKISWKDLDDPLRTILIKHGFVRKTGKIIRHITEKFAS